jgi:hypothetical protein
MKYLRKKIAVRDKDSALVGISMGGLSHMPPTIQWTQGMMFAGQYYCAELVYVLLGKMNYFSSV